MRTLKALERIEPSAPEPSPRPAWGVPQRLMLLGAALLVIALIAAGGLWKYQPVAPTAAMSVEFLQRHIEKLSLIDSVRAYYLTVEEGLEASKPKSDVVYQRRLEWWRAWLGLMAVIGGLGLVLTVAGGWAAIARRRAAGRGECGGVG